jgi:hypothetical protein
MTGSDLMEQRRLVLQVARDVAAQAYLRTLLVLADTTLAAHRDELLALGGRIKRARTRRGALAGVRRVVGRIFDAGQSENGDSTTALK